MEIIKIVLKAGDRKTSFDTKQIENPNIARISTLYFVTAVSQSGLLRSCFIAAK